MSEKWSIIIPCYNEEFRVGAFLDSVLNFLDGECLQYEIIIVNDGSADRTIRIAQEFMPRAKGRMSIVNIENNMGKGYAIMRGFLCARGDFICTIDADGATPIGELKKAIRMFRQEEGVDIIIGSRELKSHSVTVIDHWYRRIMGYVFNLIVRGITGLKFRDTQCGFKNYRYSTCVNIFKDLKTHGWAHDVEILMRARKLSLNIKEVPVNWKAVKGSKISLISGSFAMVAQVLHISLNFSREK